MGQNASGQPLATTRCDVLLLGAGLANSLIALELRRRHPHLAVTMLDRRTGPDTLHTWCLFQPDVPPDAWLALQPVFERVWPGYQVAFGTRRRRLATPYACLTGTALSAVVGSALGGGLVEGAEVVEVSPAHARLADGRVFEAQLVIDGRGFRPSPTLRLAWQKFAGLEVRLDRPHGIDLPVVMDATVPQLDGYRFIYVLPLDERRLLIEDTRYSDGPALDAAALEGEVLRHAAAQGWAIQAVLRREQGVLPITLGGDPDAMTAGEDGPPCVGLRGGFFHPTTGYSLPRAVQVARLVADTRPLSTAAVSAVLRDHARSTWRRDRMFRLLNRMLFRAAKPESRHRVLDRFYRLPQPLIERFYAGHLSVADCVRLLWGRPPVPVLRALGAMMDRPHHA